MKRKSLVLGVLLSLVVASAAAQSYPTRAVKFILPFGPGSATDIIARALADEFRVELGEPFVVENRAGANGFIAAEAVARAAPDGYTILVTSPTTHSTNPFLFKKLPYDPVKDFEPVGLVIEAYYTLTVRKELPVNSMAELITWLKANQQTASYGWGATVSQITGWTFLKRAGTTATGIPYKSSPQAVIDLIGGQFTFMFQDVTTALAHVRAGRVKALAVTSAQRLPAMPDVPTMAEAGMPDFQASAYVAVLAPAGTPEPIVRKLNETLNKVLKKPTLISKIDSCCAAVIMTTTPAGLGDYLNKDRAYWSERIAAVGIRPE